LSTRARRSSVLMLLENNPYPHDVRVRREAETLTDAGYDVTVVAPRRGDQPLRERVRGVRVRRFPLREGSGVGGILAEYAVAHLFLFAAAVRYLVGGARVVHAHNPPDTLFPAGLLARALGRRFVYDHHDLGPELFEDKFGGGPAVRVLRLAQRLSVRSADVVIATNGSQADAMRAHARDGTPVAIVRNGPVAATIASDPRVRSGQLTDPHLIFVGTIESQDGVFDLPALLDAVDRELGGAARLTVVGEGTARPELERLLADREPRVEFTGRVPHEQVSELIANADIAIDPAPCTPLNDRSTMIKVAEYLAAGVPTVAYRLRETEVTGAHAVSYADCGDPESFARAVAALARDEDARRAAARAAIGRARELTWEISAGELLRAYESVGLGAQG
jgi:glycosyltransferase involved in cell wall biosynthesis